MSELTPLEQIRLIMQDLTDSQRTIYCNPEWESRIKTMADAYGVGGLWKVEPMPGWPLDKVYVVDHNALEAQHRQNMQRLRNEPIRFFEPDPRPLWLRYRWL